MTPIAKGEATAYRERWPSWVHEAFKIEPVVNEQGSHFVEIACTIELKCLLVTLPIDLRHDPPPALLREMRVHMKGHAFEPQCEKGNKA
ncbi:MAG TPA: hypothetical protein VNV25_25420 [Gemmatimonadaceae bacterium]|nr:hypothetical protein [Gemmatimonadaceae bacterium]